MLPRLTRARDIARWTLPAREVSRLGQVHVQDAGHGYDALGLHADWVAAAAGVAGPLFDRYFRVTSHGSQHIPSNGAAILVANHSGTIPLDAAMLYLDVLRHTHPPRVLRVVTDHFVVSLPFVATLYARIGAVSGTRPTLERLLRAGELVAIFPEGTPAIGKRFRERYQLREFRLGHAELALKLGVPIIPVAIIGAEEAFPQLAKLTRVRPFGSPYMPVPAVPFPLPVHFRIYYGPPVAHGSECDFGCADDPDCVASLADRARAAVAELIAQGLREREGWFR